MGSSLAPTPSVGRVESVTNEICLVHHLPDVKLSSLVEFSSGSKGIVIGFDTSKAQIITLDNYMGVKKGDLVRVIDSGLKVPVGNQLLGRVLDPLCLPLDGLGIIDTDQKRYIESPAKPLYHRSWVDKPLMTGYLLIDSQIPVGLGQRELLVGEKKAGSADVAAEIINNQARIGAAIKTVYVTIDAESAATKRRIEYLRSTGALKNTVVIVGRTSESASLNYVAPMTGMTIAEWFASNGEDVLIIFDNLTRHAKAYRHLSLLLNRPASREAYPGDIFYLHSRLLERSGAFSKEAGGGSITALPIVETQSEEATDFITTNLMSITDGHILFRQSLANRGMQPAIDSGFSVSRIGGRAQHPLIRELSDELRHIVTRYNEVERFLAFGSDLSSSTIDVIEKGKRAYSLFYQPAGQAYSVDQQVLLMQFLLSSQALRWSNQQMPEVKRQLLEYAVKPEQKPILDKACALNDAPTAKELINSILDDFRKDPHTVKPAKRDHQLIAETETIASLLRDDAGSQNG